MLLTESRVLNQTLLAQITNWKQLYCYRLSQDSLCHRLISMLKANVSVVLLFFRPIIFFVLLCHLLTQILSFIEKELNIVIKLLRLKKIVAATHFSLSRLKFVVQFVL